MRLGRERHKHTPEFHRQTIDSMTTIEICKGCGRRRLSRQGYGTESGTYYSRWFDISELQKLQRCFPEAFHKKEKKSVWKQAFGFAVVGFFGTIVNGIVFSALSLIPIFNGVPLDWWIFKQITWAWGFGILAGFVFNFILDKWIVFKA